MFKPGSMFLVIYKTSSTANIQVCLDLIYYCRGDQFNQVIKLRWPFKTFTTQLLMFAGLYIEYKEIVIEPISFLERNHSHTEMGFRGKPWISMQHVGGKSELQCTKTWEKERRHRQTALQSQDSLNFPVLFNLFESWRRHDISIMYLLWT